MYSKSWVTQRIANRLPLWSDARTNPYSFLQQFMNPVGRQLEDLYKYMINQNKNHFIMSANLDLLDSIYEVKLPQNYIFGQDRRNLANMAFVAPRVTAMIDGTETDITLATDNSLKNFHEDALPTRVLDASSSVSIATPILPATPLSTLESATPGTIAFANRLAVTISGCTSFVDNSRITPVSFLILQGTTSRGLEETEFMYITNNGIFITRKTWSTLTSVQYFGLQPNTGTVQIDMFHFNKDREVDRYILFVDASAEKFLYHRITDKTFGTCEQHLRVTANTLGDLYRGVDTLEVMKEIELGWDNAGTFTNVTLHDIAIQPFTGLLYGIDDTHLYIFDPHDELPDYSGMKVSDPGAEMVPQSDYVDYIIDDTAIVTPFWRTPNTRIYANRWHVTKPDGTQVYVLMDGSEVPTTTAAAGWIYNQGYTEVVFGPFDNGSGEMLDKQRLELTLDQRGTWLITLEVLTVDSTRYKSCIPLHVHSKTALTRLPLPVALAGATGIAFDSSQRLWLLSGTTANMLDLATDTMLVDFNKKVIYLHEPYDSVTVYPSEDVTD